MYSQRSIREKELLTRWQRELKVNTSQLSELRKNESNQVAIGLSFAFGYLRGWREFSWPINHKAKWSKIQIIQEQNRAQQSRPIWPERLKYGGTILENVLLCAVNVPCTMIALALTYHSRKDVVSRKVLTLVWKFLFLLRLRFFSSKTWRLLFFTSTVLLV